MKQVDGANVRKIMTTINLVTLFIVALFCNHAYSLTKDSVLQELASPWTTEAKNPLLIGSGLTFASILVAHQVENPMQKDTAEDKPLGKFSHVGDWMGRLIPNVLYWGSMKISYWNSDNVESNRYAEGMFKATLYSGLICSILKYAVREPRPNGRSRNSFPSGHTTSAFAFAATVGANHGWKWGIPAYSIATLVAASRMNDNAHWLHDVIAGATLGIGYGLGINYLLNSEALKQNIVIYPTYYHSQAGVAVTYLY